MLLRTALSDKKGITIQELLVVIALICLLLAILFPVFVKAKASNRTVRCAINLMQLGSAFVSYSSDWYDTLPCPGGLSGDLSYWSQTGRGGLVSYVGKNGGIGTIWCCPEQTSWNGCYPARTYSMNSFLRWPPDIFYPTSIRLLRGCPVGRIEDKNRTILLYEGVPILGNWSGRSDGALCNYIYRCGMWEQVTGWKSPDRPRHGHRNNYLYADGHVVTKAPDKYPNIPKISLSNEWFVQKSVVTRKYGQY